MPLRRLDRYVIREILPPFLLSLLIFTFILTLPPVMKQLEQLVAKGVSWDAAARIIATLNGAFGNSLVCSPVVQALSVRNRIPQSDRFFIR